MIIVTIITIIIITITIIIIPAPLRAPGGGRARRARAGGVSCRRGIPQVGHSAGGVSRQRGARKRDALQETLRPCGPSGFTRALPLLRSPLQAASSCHFFAVRPSPRNYTGTGLWKCWLQCQFADVGLGYGCEYHSSVMHQPAASGLLDACKYCGFVFKL